MVQQHIVLQRKLTSLVDKFTAENKAIEQSLQSLQADTLEPLDTDNVQKESVKKATREIQGVHPDLFNDSDEDDDAPMSTSEPAQVGDKCLQEEAVDSSDCVPSTTPANKDSDDGKVDPIE